MSKVHCSKAKACVPVGTCSSWVIKSSRTLYCTYPKTLLFLTKHVVVKWTNTLWLTLRHHLLVFSCRCNTNLIIQQSDRIMGNLNPHTPSLIQTNFHCRHFLHTCWAFNQPFILSSGSHYTYFQMKMHFYHSLDSIHFSVYRSFLPWFSISFSPVQ